MINAFFGATVGLGIAGLATLIWAHFGAHSDFALVEILPSYYMDTMLQVPWQKLYEKGFYFLAITLGTVSTLLFGMRRREASVIRIAPITLPYGRGIDVVSLLIFLIIVVLAVKPNSLKDIATTLTDPHIGSYLFAPALQFLSPDAVPGRDFESHYGVALPFLFSKLLGSNFEESSYRAAAFMWILTTLFHATVFLTIKVLAGTTGVALVVGLLIFISGFDGFSFSIPSDLPLRFLFCPTFILLCALSPGSARPKLLTALTGVVSGIALLWQTDTGVYCIVSGLALFTFLVIGRKVSLVYLLLFIAATCATFLAGFTFIVGPSNLAVDTLFRLYEPIILYSGGFGAVRMQWSSIWSFIYNIGSPLVISACAGYAAIRLLKSSSPSRKEISLLLLSVFSAITLVKWVNRSIDVLWWLNGWPILMMLGIVWAIITEPFGQLKRTCLGLAVLSGLVLVLFLGKNKEIAQGLSRAPIVRWHSYFFNHPSKLSDVYLKLRGITRDPQSRRHERVVKQEATLFLRQHTKPQERVAILSSADWHYHIDALRPSLLYWLPLHLTHTYRLLDRNIANLREAKILFVERGYWTVLEKWNSIAFEKTRKIVETDYTLVKTNEDWIVLKKNNANPGQQPN